MKDTMYHFLWGEREGEMKDTKYHFLWGEREG